MGLVEEPALTRAEQECLNDAEARALSRERAAERRALMDAGFVTAFAEKVQHRYPGCPHAEARCRAAYPDSFVVGAEHSAACWRHEPS